MVQLVIDILLASSVSRAWEIHLELRHNTKGRPRLLVLCGIRFSFHDCRDIPGCSSFVLFKDVRGEESRLRSFKEADWEEEI